ncbi:hypothetical protein [Nonomuraea sp. NPDC049784]
MGLPAAWLLALPAGRQTLGARFGLFIELTTTTALLLARFRRGLPSQPN